MWVLTRMRSASTSNSCDWIGRRKRRNLGKIVVAISVHRPSDSNRPKSHKAAPQTCTRRFPPDVSGYVAMNRSNDCLIYLSCYSNLGAPPGLSIPFPLSSFLFQFHSFRIVDGFRPAMEPYLLLLSCLAFAEVAAYPLPPIVHRRRLDTRRESRLAGSRLTLRKSRHRHVSGPRTGRPTEHRCTARSCRTLRTRQ